MKKIFNRAGLAAVAMAFALSLNVQAADVNDYGGIARYAQANKALEGKSRVVLLGNSITDNWARMDAEFFTENGYVGRGISGQTSSQFLVRFREDVINLHPKAVVINAGTNDIAENTGAYNEDITMGHIISMVELAQSNDIKVILTSVLPAAKFGWRLSITDSAEKIAALNARIKAYADAHQIPYVDYYTHLVTGEDCALNPKYSKDGVHPTIEGYKVMEAVVKPVIEALLAK